MACLEVLAAFALLIAFSGAKSLWLDEALTLFSVLDWERMWIFIVSQESGKFWLHHLPAYVLWHTGASEFWFRSYSVFFATASVPLVIAIGYTLGGRRTGLVAGLLMAVQPNLVAHGQEVRMYAMLEFFTALGAYLFIRGLRDKSALVWLAYGFAMALAIATHLFAILSLAGHLVVVLPRLGSSAVRRGLFVGAGATAILTGISFIALGSEGLVTTSRGADWLPTPTLRTLLGFAHFAAGQTFPWWLYCAMLVTAAAIVGVKFVKRSRQRWPALIVLGALVVPVTVAFIVSIAIQPVS